MDEILNRGMFDKKITQAKITLIGGGALGSMLAEMFIRGGVVDLTIIDHEKTELGNLARHTLSLEDVGKFKIEALCQRLLQILPHARVKGINDRLEHLHESDVNIVKDSSIVIDCTGSDDVLAYLEGLAWSNRPIFCSASIGLQARRLYVLIARKSVFPKAFFVRHIEKWLQRDLQQYDGEPFPRSGGIGCWHPAFPARVDDMWLFAATALKYLEGYVRANVVSVKLAVFQQVQDGTWFHGVKLIAEECDNG